MTDLVPLRGPGKAYHRIDSPLASPERDRYYARSTLRFAPAEALRRVAFRHRDDAARATQVDLAPPIEHTGARRTFADPTPALDAPRYRPHVGLFDRCREPNRAARVTNNTQST